MGPSSPKHVVLVLHQFINSLHKGTEPAPAPPHRDPGGGGGAASHHLAAEPEQVPQRPDLKFDEGLVRLLLNARPAGDRRPDLSRQAEGGHDTVQLKAWTLAPYPDSSQQRAVVVLARGVPVSGRQSMRKTETRVLLQDEHKP